MWKQNMWKLTAFVETFVGTSVDTLVGRFVGTFVGSPWKAKTGKWTFVGALVGTLVGALVGAFADSTMPRRPRLVRRRYLRWPIVNVNQSRFSGRGWGQQLFSLQSPAVQCMARTSLLNCLSCRNPYQTPVHWIASPHFTEKLFFSLKSASPHPLPKNRLWVTWEPPSSTCVKMEQFVLFAFFPILEYF